MGLAHDIPMTETRFHRTLVLTERMQNIPAALMVLFFLAFFWLDPVTGAAVFLTWFMLWMLPRARRSYGPEKASTLALTVLMALVSLIMRLLGLPVVAQALALGLIIALAFYATWIEPFRLQVTTQRLKSEKLHRSLRVLHLGDLHMEHFSPRERHLNQLIAELKPDLIVFSGDFVNLSYTANDQVRDEIRAVIREWSAPLGTYCVPGTPAVEPLERVREFTHGLENLRLLTNEWVTAGEIHIAGMITTHIIEQDRAALAALTRTAPDGFKLLLTHSPDVAPEADSAGFDLYLCGHTHGGQIRFPFIGALFTGSRYGQRFIMGREELHHTVVYTTRGIGMEGMGAPRARFLCPPEIILWEVNP